MGSGASAVLVRRRLAANEAASSPPPTAPVTDVQRKRPRTTAGTGAPSADSAGRSAGTAAPDPGQDGGDVEAADADDCESTGSALDESGGSMGTDQSAVWVGTRAQGGVRRKAVDGLLVFNSFSRTPRA